MKEPNDNSSYLFSRLLVDCLLLLAHTSPALCPLVEVLRHDPDPIRGVLVLGAGEGFVMITDFEIVGELDGIWSVVFGEVSWL